MLKSTNQTIPAQQESLLTCHLVNNDNGKTYYSGVSAKLSASKEDCVLECHSTCQICWSSADCEPVCSEDREFKIEGFKTDVCNRPFYYCNSGLTKYTYIENGETRAKKFIGM